MSRYLDPKSDVVLKELLEVPEIAEAVALSEESAYTPGQLEVYESYWDWVRREKTLIADGYAEGKAKGLAEGEEKLNHAKQTIAKNLLNQGISVEIVMASTGFTRQDIDSLLK